MFHYVDVSLNIVVFLLISLSVDIFSALTVATVTDIKNKLLAKYQVSFSFVLTSFYHLFINLINNIIALKTF